jgi:hypothetical protein
MASPADILRVALVAAGVVQMPGVPGQLLPYVQQPGDASILCYVGSMPEDVSQAVCLYDNAGRMFGRRQRDGKEMIHAGVKALVRFPTYDYYDRVNTLALAMQSLTRTGVIQSVYRTSPIISLGEETNRRRQRWSFNLRIAFTDAQPQLG